MITWQIEQTLKQEGISHFEKDIRTMTTAELKKNFCVKSSGRVNITRLMKNIIWQAYEFLQQGKIEPIDDNIGFFWYTHIKPVLSRLGIYTNLSMYKNKMYRCFTEMVTKHCLFHYIDFSFVDERSYSRVLGNNNGHLIVFVEKDALFKVIKRLAVEHDLTAISLGSTPSWLATEYLVGNMKKKGLLTKPVHLFSIVDYDPYGYCTEQVFLDQLQFWGVKITSFDSLVNPKNLPRKLINLYKYKIKKSPKVKKWLAKTGGIAKAPFGLESEALGSKMIVEICKKAIQPYLDN